MDSCRYAALTSKPGRYAMNKTTKFTLIIVVGFLLYAILTGGVIIYKLDDFGGQRDVVFAEGLKSDVWVDPNFKAIGAPFLGFIYLTEKPCSFRVQIWDDSKKYSGIFIESISIQYENESFDMVNMNWRQNLIPHTQISSSAEGNINTPILMLSKNTPKIVTKYINFEAVFKGYLITKDSKKKFFEVSDKFEYEPKFGVTTLWISPPT